VTAQTLPQLSLPSWLVLDSSKPLTLSNMNKDIYHSAIGIITPMLGVVTSLQENIEYSLRISGLIVGLIVGLASLYRILKK
jgi:hypothetical protein